MAIKYLNVADPLLIVNSAINVIASAVVVVTIFILVKKPDRNGGREKKFNVYIQIILFMSVFQGITDASLFLNYGCRGLDLGSVYECQQTYIYIFFSALFATNAWSNALSTVLAYIILTRKSPELGAFKLPIFSALFLVCTVGTVLITNLCGAEWLKVLDSVRLLQIVYNCVLIGAIWVPLLQGQLLTTSYEDRHKDPLYALVQKVSFYPLIQSLTSIPACLYDFQYGPTTLFTNNASTAQAIYFFIWVVLQPLGGVLTLGVFFVTQKGSKEAFLSIFCGSKYTNNDKDQIDSGAKAGQQNAMQRERPSSSRVTSDYGLERESNLSIGFEQHVSPPSQVYENTELSMNYFDFNEGELVEEIIRIQREKDTIETASQNRLRSTEDSLKSASETSLAMSPMQSGRTSRTSRSSVSEPL